MLESDDSCSEMTFITAVVDFNILFLFNNLVVLALVVASFVVENSARADKKVA